MLSTVIGYLVVGVLTVWLVGHLWNYYYKSPLARKVRTFEELVEGVEEDINRAKEYIHIRVKVWDDDLYLNERVFCAMARAVERGVQIVIRIDDDFIPSWEGSKDPYANLLTKWIKEGKIFLYNQKDDDEVRKLSSSGVYISIDGFRFWAQQKEITPQKRGLYFLYILRPSKVEALPN